MRLGIPGAIMNARNFSRKSDFERDFFPDDLGVDLSRLPTISPVSIEKMPTPTPATAPATAPATGGIPGTNWWQTAGYPDAATAIMSGNFRYDMNRGWVPIEETSTVTPTPLTQAPEVVAAQETREKERQAKQEADAIAKYGSVENMQNEIFKDMGMPEVPPMDSDIDRAIAAALSGAENPVLNVDEAVEAAVGNGQPTTDDTITRRKWYDNRTERPTGKTNPNLEAFLNSPMYKDFQDRGGIGTMDMYTASDGTEFGSGTVGKMYEQFLKDQAASQPNTGTQQPDFMTQLQELIAQMQAEQTTAAEQAAAAEAERQKQAAEMTQNYTIGQPAVGYNPYQSGQYQNNPYGSAGVPDMGGITSIPVPAAYQPYQPPGGAT
jgi:hypothetical protein